MSGPPRDGRTTGPLKPNLILILADDLDAASVAYMPNLKRLILDQGTTFQNAYVNTPLCCPSRVSILRGQYTHNHQVLTNAPPDGGFATFQRRGLEESTIATWLAAAGYETALLGKYLNGYPERSGPTHLPPGWSTWYAFVEPGEYKGFNYEINFDGQLLSYGQKPKDYATDILSDLAVSFVRENATRGFQPFFMYLAPSSPHEPATPAPRHTGLLREVIYPRGPSFDEADVSEKPGWVQQLPRYTPTRLNRVDPLFRSRLLSLQAVDEMIAALVDSLEDVGRIDETYIIFTSDNGFHFAEHRLGVGKGSPYEEDIRVPFFIRGPGVPGGRVVDHLVGNVDLAPTLARLAGASIPGFVDGRSLTPLLGADAPPADDAWRRAFLVEYTAGEGIVPTYDGFRTRRYTYVEYRTGDREIYDLSRDPYQLNNIYRSVDPDIRRASAMRLAALRRCRAESCRSEEAADGFAELDARDVVPAETAAGGDL